MPNIKRNAAQCLVCNVTIESKHRHDFVACKCYDESGGTKGIFLDGGKDYIRRGGDFTNAKDLSE